jgi:transposase
MRETYSVPGCRVERVVPGGSAAHVLVVRGARRSARCPSCGEASQAVHSTYRRCPADLPSLGHALRLELLVRRFYCRRTVCPRRTFAEPVRGLLDRYARRTRRLAAAQRAVALAAGAETGRRVLARLAMPTSADTLLRLMRAAPLPQHGSPQRLGVDDWARRKGQTYGTIVVDLDAHRVVDLLPDRTAETLTTWLRQRPTVALVARDRSTEYTRAITAAVPAAVQVADRWHLLLNVRQMAERWLTSMHGRLRQLPASVAAEPVPERRVRAFRRTRAEAAASAAYRAHWEALYVEVQRRHAAGEPLMRIGRALDLARSTVRRLAYAPTFPERGTPPVPRSILDPYLPHLAQRQQAGCENALHLWREIRTLGYPGTARQVHRWLQQHRRHPAPTDPTKYGASPPSRCTPTSRAPP